MAVPPLKRPHYEVDESKYHRVFVIGDVHGRAVDLEYQLDKRNFNSKRDLLIILGDIIDRGPDSEAMLTLLHSDAVLALFGNHEQMMFEALNKELGWESVKRMWVQNGGHWHLKVDGVKLQAYLKLMLDKMPLAVTLTLCNGKKVGFVHGEVPGLNWQQFVENAEQSGDRGDENWFVHALWSRRLFDRKDHSSRVRWVDWVVHGHSPVSVAPLVYNNRIYIDTSFNKELALFEINELLDAAEGLQLEALSME